jgi:hypothetical protein
MNQDARINAVLAGRQVERCRRCGHWWFKRLPQRTVVCPWRGCKSAYWETEAKQTPLSQERHFNLCTSPDCLLLARYAVEGMPAAAQ